MAGSGASNLGYAEIEPNSNIDGLFVNKYNSDYSAWFTDTTIPTHGSRGTSNNVLAAKGVASCQRGGGGSVGRRKKRTIKKTLKNNKSIYYIRKMKKRLSKKMKMNRRRKGSKKYGVAKKKYRTRRNMRGGYDQYANNVPYTPNYSTGGPLPAGLSALANPAPYHVLENHGTCPDNYNHFKAPITKA